MMKYDHLEIARIIGQPRDPAKPYSDLIAGTCQTDTAMPNEYVYYFDVLVETNKIYTTVASGVTQENVVPDSPALMSFVDLASPEYYVKITDLANAKEATLARKKATINRALNAEENWRVIQLIEAAAVGQGNTNIPASGYVAFTYKSAVDMIDQVIDYSDGYKLIVGTEVAKSIQLMDWNNDKYNSQNDALKALGIDIIRVNQPLTRDGGSTTVMPANYAYLVGTNTEVGAPLLFVRKRLNEIDMLGGTISDTGDKAERLVFVSPNPVQVSSTRFLAVGMTGYEQIAAVTLNPYAFSKFSQ
jgi:hypothetical protein